MRRHWTFEDVPNREVATWWDERPCNVQHSKETVGSKKYFEEVAARKYLVEPHLWQFIQDIGRVDTVLDAGCGIGTTTVTLSDLATSTYAVDASPVSVEIARRNVELRSHDPSRVMLYDCDLTRTHELTYKVPRPIDCIFSWGVIHHIPRPDHALRALWNLAGPNTELRLMVYNRWSSKALRLGLTNRRVARGSEARPGSPVTYTFTRRRLRRVLKSTGWTVERMWVDHIFPYEGDLYGQRRILRVARPWRWMPYRLFRRIERVIGWHLMVIARPTTR